MKCPECGGNNDPGVAICQHCDHILDASFLGDDYTAEPEEPRDFEEDEFEDTPPEGTPASDTQSGPAPTAPPRRGRSRGSRFVVGRSQDGGYDAFDSEDEDEAEQYDPEFDEIERQRAALRAKRDKADQAHSLADAPAEQREAIKDELGRVNKDMEESLGKAKEFVKSLGKHDKICLGGAAGMLIFPLFPWVSVSGQGSLSGFEVGGWLISLLALCVGSLIYLRQDEHWQAREKYVLIAQAAVVAIAILFLLFRMITIGSIKAVAPDGLSLPAGSYSVGVGIGLLLSLICTGVAGFGTFFPFKEKVLGKK